MPSDFSNAVVHQRLQRTGPVPRTLENICRFWYHKLYRQIQVISVFEVDVMLMGVTSVVEPVCPAMTEAAAIVEAEWIRLRRPSEPARHPVCELPSARRCPPRTNTMVARDSRPTKCSPRTRRHVDRCPISLVWARQRSPPVHA